VRSLDRILVFDRGKIVEQGSHAALAKRPGGIYRGLFERQVLELDRVAASTTACDGKAEIAGSARAISGSGRGL
jgi:ABC-type dipeptide/oligopeptide/nickel transport system ATPase component